MLYIITHKKAEIPDLENYRTLQVGAALHDNLGFLKDNAGDNISAKNPNFCELTGLYWIWKNTDDDYKGLVHYRRYFGHDGLFSGIKNIYSYNELTDMLKKADIVLPYKEKFLQDAKHELLIQCCTEPIFDELRKAVEKTHPDYLKSFDEFFSQNSCTLFNMLFCKREYFDSYCGWLFGILFELESNISLDGLNDYQKRLYGFLAERLLNVWVRHNDLRAVHTGVINTQISLKEKLTFIRRRITNDIRFKLSKK